MKVFVSHSSLDNAVFTTIDLVLKSAGFDRWDSSTMSAGEPLADQLKDAINQCSTCIFIATQRSIQSPWCLAELGAFWGTGKRVLLFMADPDLTDSVMPPQFKGLLRVENASDLIEATERAIRDYETEVSELSTYQYYRSCGEYGTEKNLGENSVLLRITHKPL